MRTVLAALLLARGRLLSDDHLSYLLWGENPPSTPNAQIYTYVSRLRKCLGPAVNIERRRPGYTMDIGRLDLDVVHFERLSRTGRDALRHNRYSEAAELLRAALACWRGPALSNVTENLASAELHHLEEARMVALDGRIEADLALGNHAHLIPELTLLVAEQPLRERLRAQLMIALYRFDRQADALAVYHDARRVLAEEMGSDPGANLTEVYQAILAGDNARLWPAEVQASAIELSPVPTRPLAMLPPDIADFTGRESELEMLGSCLRAGPPWSSRRERCAVISGMPGTGKSTLAIHCAHELSDEFPDGVLYADLGGTSSQVTDPGDALGWFLDTLKVDRGTVPADAQQRSLLYRSLVAGRRMLVVLDNATDDEQVRPLLPRSAGCGVIVTGRTRMTATMGAETIDLEPLEPWTALLLLAKIVGAKRIWADPARAQRVVDLCGGLPLCLRVAGVRLLARPHWPLSRLLDRLDDDCRRLNELSVGEMGIRESMHTSYERICERAKTALWRLAQLKVAEFPAWTVAAVLGVPLATGEEIAEALVDARLLDARLDQSGRSRYRFHELVRLFAREQAPPDSEPVTFASLS